MTERQIEKWLGNQVKALGCLYYKFISPGTAGVPDRLIILPCGLVIFTELKAENGKLSASQERCLSVLKDHSCDAIVIRGMAEAESLVRDIKKHLAIEDSHEDRRSEV